MKKTKTIPFSFVLDQLYSINPIVRPMFGCFAVYRQNKMVLMLRSKEELPYDNGVWIATTPEHHESLKKEFPSVRPVRLLGANVTAWQNIPSEADDFEETVLRVCELILHGDPRIGKVPKPRKKKTKP
jgi:hypothetical protein